MLDRLLHHKVLTDGLEGEGVITERKVEGGHPQAGLAFYIGVEGHIKFGDGTEARFSSKGLDTSRTGDLDVGMIVPVRYDADHNYVALDVPKLEAEKAAKKKADADWLERYNAQQIAASDAILAEGS